MRPIMAKIMTAFVCACALLAVGACGSGSYSQWIGEWEGRRDLNVPEGADPAIAETLSRVRLDLRPDRTFILTEAGLTYEGLAVVRDDRLALEVRLRQGNPIDREPDRVQAMLQGLELEWLSEDEAILHDPNGFHGPTLDLSRRN